MSNLFGSIRLILGQPAADRFDKLTFKFIMLWGSWLAFISHRAMFN